MTFAERLSQYSAADIVAALNCPRSTVYDWLANRRTPPKWQHDTWLAVLAERRGKNAHASTSVAVHAN
jgi:hypothetical protein